MAEPGHLVDSNILLRLSKRDDPRYPVIRAAVLALRDQGTPWLCPTNSCRSSPPNGPTPERGALAVIALNLYREGKLSTAQLRRVLGFYTRIHVHAFLKEHDVLLQYGAADLEHDRQAGDSIQIQPAVWAEESTP